MPNTQCLCGHTITLGAIPSPNKYRIMPDMVVEDFVAELLQDPSNQEHIFDSFYKFIIDAIKCPHCNRLWIEELNGEYRSYWPEPL